MYRVTRIDQKNRTQIAYQPNSYLAHLASHDPVFPSSLRSAVRSPQAAVGRAERRVPEPHRRSAANRRTLDLQLLPRCPPPSAWTLLLGRRPAVHCSRRPASGVLLLRGRGCARAPAPAGSSSSNTGVRRRTASLLLLQLSQLQLRASAVRL